MLAFIIAFLIAFMLVTLSCILNFLQGDSKNKDAIKKTFTFADFNQAWSFMSRSALLAEKVCNNTFALMHYLMSSLIQENDGWKNI